MDDGRLSYKGLILRPFQLGSPSTAGSSTGATRNGRINWIIHE
jgi:hypothetical protein